MSKNKATAPESAMTTVPGFKGFNRNLRCRGFQYELGKTYTHDGKVSLCNSGLHFCEDPLDVLAYYPPTERFAEVRAEGVTDERDGDSKRAAKTLHIGAELSLNALLQRGIKFRLDKIDFTQAEASSDKGSGAASATDGHSGSSMASPRPASR